MSRIVSMVMALGLLLMSSTTAIGESYTVDKKYSSTDTLSDDSNYYYITADDDKKIDYSISVVGGGTCKIYFCPGHGDPQNYYERYSAEDVDEYDNSFSVDSDDGEKFTIKIQTKENNDITYEIKIEVKDSSLSWQTMIVICVAIILFVGIVLFIMRRFIV